MGLHWLTAQQGRSFQPLLDPKVVLSRRNGTPRKAYVALKPLYEPVIDSTAPWRWDWTLARWSSEWKSLIPEYEAVMKGREWLDANE